MCVPSQNRCDECKQPLTHLRATPVAYHVPWPSIFMNQLAHFHLDFQEFIYPIYKQNPSSLCLHFHRTSKLVIQKILHRSNQSVFQAQLLSWRIEFPLIIRPLNKAPLLYVPFSNPQMYDRILVTNAIKNIFIEISVLFPVWPYYASVQTSEAWRDEIKPGCVPPISENLHRHLRNSG